MTVSQIRQYRVIEKIGEGAMGTVFKADDTNLHRPVALKILGESHDAAGARARVLREARSASALNHPNICIVYEAGEHEGVGFIAMEWIDGVPLSTAIPSGGLPVDTVVRYGGRAASNRARPRAGGKPTRRWARCCANGTGAGPKLNRRSPRR